MTTDKAKTSRVVFVYWTGALLLAAAVFIFFPLISTLFSVQLREASTVIAEFFLKMMTFSVTRNSTILSLPGMVFDVVPACNGSNTIRVLVVMGVLWSGIHMGLSPGGKVLLAALSVPIALVANGLRVALLIWGSYLSGSIIIEGPLHTLIGAFVFVLAMGAFFSLGQLLCRPKGKKAECAAHRNYCLEMLAFTVLLLTIAYLPFFAACFKAWKGAVYNTNDLYGYILFIAAAWGWIWAWRRYPENYHAAALGLACCILITLLAVLSQATGPNNYMLGLTFLGTLFSIGLMYRGTDFSLRTLPLYLVFFLSYPKVTEFINDLLHFTGLARAFAVKILLSALALFLFYRLVTRSRTVVQPVTARRFFCAGMTAMAFLFFCCQVLFMQRDYTAMAGNYFYPYFFTGKSIWKGRDVTDPSTKIFYERENNIIRHYDNTDNKTVGMIIIPSDGNRKKIHTPEYCQTGLGWQITEKGFYTFYNAKKRKIRARELQLTHPDKDITRTFIYWFSNGRESYAEYPMFLLVDTLHKLLFKKDNWFLYIVWSDQGKEVAENFLSLLPEIQQQPAEPLP